MKCLIASAAAAMLLAPQQTDTPEENEALPLEATGTIEFTTDEVTWMSLDVSPDGSTVVFDLLGDLYTLPITGGEATRIFGDMSFESQPTFSPDGETIAFLSDRSGRVRSSWRRPRGRSTATTCWCRSRVHPSERSACSCTTKTVRPACVSVPRLRNRSRPNRVNGARGLPTNSARWRRPTDASSISVSGSARSTNNAQFPIWQIMRFDRETSETATITNAQGSAMRPVLSPDGSHLVFATRFRTQTGLRVRNLETGAERWLIYPVTRDDQESRASRDTMPGYAFVPDGTGLVVPIGGKLHLVDFATGAAQGIPFTAEVAAEIGPRIHFDGRVDDSDTVEARVIRWPALSPAGDRLAFSAFNRIWVMDLPGGTPQRLTDLDVASSCRAGRAMAVTSSS